MYKFIALDLDDTLLGSDLRISRANKRAILNATEKGIYVTIVTGRMYNSVLPFVNDLNISIPVIAFQGAYTKDPVTKKLMDKKVLPLKCTEQIIKDCIKNNLHLQIYTEDGFYYRRENAYSQQYEKLSGIKGNEIDDLNDTLDKDPIKMIIIDEPEKIAKFNENYKSLYENELQIVISKPSYLEFTHIEATKGKAVEQLSTKLGVKKEAIIAIGDSYNDISMIEYAGLGVAMDNAPDDVKKKADYITMSNDEDGIAETINKFVLREVI